MWFSNPLEPQRGQADPASGILRCRGCRVRRRGWVAFVAMLAGRGGL